MPTPSCLSVKMNISLGCIWFARIIPHTEKKRVHRKGAPSFSIISIIMRTF